MSALSTTTLEILTRLRTNTEGSSITEHDGSVWKTVYLENAIPPGMNRHAFAGHLSALKEAGVYRPQGSSREFGDVKLLLPRSSC